MALGNLLRNFVIEKKISILFWTLLSIAIFGSVIFFTRNIILSSALIFAIAYVLVQTYNRKFFPYFDARYEPADENQYIMEYMLEHEYKRFDNNKDDYKQIQTVAGLILTGIILFFAIGNSDNTLIIQGFMVGLLGVALSLLLLVSIKHDELPIIVTESRSELYQKIRKINERNSYQNVFARIFLLIAVLFAIIMIFALYYGYTGMLDNLINPPKIELKICSTLNNSNSTNIEFSNSTVILQSYSCYCCLDTNSTDIIRNEANNYFRHEIILNRYFSQINQTMDASLQAVPSYRVFNDKLCIFPIHSMAPIHHSGY